MPRKYEQIQEFPVPRQLKESKTGVVIKSIAIDLGNGYLSITHTIPPKTTGNEERETDYDTIKIQLTGDLDEDMATLRKWAKNNFFFIDSPDVLIDELVSCVKALYMDGAAKTIQQIKEKRDYEAKKLDEQEECKLKKRYVQKYYSSVEGVLYESVLVAGQPCFISLDVDPTTAEPFVKSWEKILLPERSDKPTMELLPLEGEEAYLSEPYKFKSVEEINQYIESAGKETLDSLFTFVKETAKKYISGTENHLTILAADTILTYFQDKLGQVHYLYFYGDNDTGKSANLTFMDHVAYRAMFDVDITAANIFTYLGTVQEGQGIILEDEADNIDRDNEKMKLYKRGYNAGGKVTRTDLTFGRKQDGYFVYGFKAFTAEKRPDNDNAKGFNERTFFIECQAGTPEYDITEITNAVAGDSEFKALYDELDSLHKLLFAYRLLHHSDILPDIKNLSVRNREKQLTKPLIRLFQKAPKCRKEIAGALADLIIKRRGVKQDTLDAKIYHVIKKLMIEEGRKEGQEVYKFTNTRIYTEVCEALGGKYKNEGKDQSFETPEHGTVSHKKITNICVDKFGANKEHSHNNRFFVFDKDKFAKSKEAYEFPEDLKLLIEQEEEENSMGVSKDTPLQPPNDNGGGRDTWDRSLGQEGIHSNVPQPENTLEASNIPTIEGEKIEKIEEISSLNPPDNNENSGIHSQDVSQVSHVPPTNPENNPSSGGGIPEPDMRVLTPEEQIAEAIERAMKDELGKEKVGLV
jgi:hypothetical protein